MDKILIIGAAGFLGRAFTHYFARRKKTIYGIDLVPPESAPVHELTKYEPVRLPDERFAGLLRAWQPDACVHCGGLASVPRSYTQPEEDYANGPALTFDLLNNIREHAPACRFILLSSAAVYGNPECLPVREDSGIEPISVYGYHKWQSEILCREFAKIYGLKTASARLFSAYGVGLRRQVIWDIIYKMLTQPKVVLQGTGAESRDFVHAHDIALAVEIIFQSAAMQGEAYNVANGVETKISDLAAMIKSILHSESSIRYSGDLPAGTPLNWKADIEQISSIGYSPQISLQAGVEGVADWCAREVRGF